MGCIGNHIRYSKADQFLQRSLVVDLEFQLFMTLVEQLLVENKQLVKNVRIDPLPAGMAPARRGMPLLKQSSDDLPRNHLGQVRQATLQFRKFGVLRI